MKLLLRLGPAPPFHLETTEAPTAGFTESREVIVPDAFLEGDVFYTTINTLWALVVNEGYEHMLVSRYTHFGPDISQSCNSAPGAIRAQNVHPLYARARVQDPDKKMVEFGMDYRVEPPRVNMLV